MTYRNDTGSLFYMTHIESYFPLLLRFAVSRGTS